MKKLILVGAIILITVSSAQAGPDFFWSNSEQNMDMVLFYTAGASVALDIAIAATLILDIETAEEATDMYEEYLEIADYYQENVYLTIDQYPSSNINIYERLRTLRERIE